MKPRSSLSSTTRAALFVVAVMTACLTIAERTTQAGQNGGKVFTAESFEQAAPRGFGDRNNSWAQAMLWWHGALYVGTSRQSLCTSLFSIWSYASIAISPIFANTWLPYPPLDPDLSCAPDGADLALQAEIWRWTPDTGVWDRVFQSPLDLDNPGTGPPAPPRVGKRLPYEIAFRGLAGHVEPDGSEALYAFGVNSTVMWDRGQLPPPRILRSTDGITFAPIPQAPGTFLGDLPFNPDHSSFRSPVSYRGKLYVLCGPIFGQGTLIGSADPARGDNAWFVAGPSNLLFYETAVFNDWLYVGGFDPTGGYTILKTRAEGPPPYQFVTVVPAGAFLQPRPSRSVVSMHVYKDRLYVGTATQTEVIRINTDDTWDLVVGSPRQITLPTGGTEWKYPISGLDAGFGHTLNDHAWWMENWDEHLYIGTYNASTGSRLGPFGPLLQHNMGAHLYRTGDGWYISSVTTTGFSNPADPFGGIFDYGVRTMAATPYGMFLGTANDYYGLAIFRATEDRARLLNAPTRLEIEQTSSGLPLLSWDPSPNADAAAFQSVLPDLSSEAASYGAAHDGKRHHVYQVWRAEVNLILLRDEVSYTGWSLDTGNKIPDWYVGPYLLIGTTSKTSFIDATIVSGKKYMYYVIEKPDGAAIRDASNLVAFPLLRPTITFAGLLEAVDLLQLRARFIDADQGTALRNAILTARDLSSGCALEQAEKALAHLNPFAVVLQPDAADLAVLIGKLIRRLELYERQPLDLLTTEFCSSRNITLRAKLLLPQSDGSVATQYVTGVPITVTLSASTTTVTTTGGILVPAGSSAVLTAPASLVQNQARFAFLYWRDTASGREIPDNPLTYQSAGPSTIIAYYGIEGTMPITVEARDEEGQRIKVPIWFSYGGRLPASGTTITSFDVLPPRYAALTLLAPNMPVVAWGAHEKRTYVFKGWTYPDGSTALSYIAFPAIVRGTAVAHYEALPKKVTISLLAQTTAGGTTEAPVTILTPARGVVSLPTTLTLKPGERFIVQAPTFTATCAFDTWYNPDSGASLPDTTLSGNVIADTTVVLRLRCP